jgi:D-lactate dehydrogenase
VSRQHSIRSIRPLAHDSQPDHVPAELRHGTPADLLRQLEAAFPPGRVLSRVSDLVRYAADASAYRMIPRAVIMAHDADDVAAVLRFCREHNHSLVFRAGGTSLSGQAQTDDLLVDVRRHWGGFEILDNGNAVRVNPGATVGQVNQVLKRYGRVLGPDPASSAVACLGGVVANNSSGMAAGTQFNSYKTVRSMCLVLADGTRIDTAAPDAEATFAAAAPDLASGLAAIRDEIAANASLAARIKKKFSIKNTSGFRLDAFLDANSPLEIFRRLVVGSQGTLAFIDDIVFETVELGQFALTSLMVFPSYESAAAAVPGFVATGARIVELMDSNTLRMAASKPEAPAYWHDLPGDSAALLVEYRAGTQQAVETVLRAGQSLADGLDLLEPATFTTDPTLTAFFWEVREGMMAGIGSTRPAGTTMIVEDVCVPPEEVAGGARDVLNLLAQHGYPPGIGGHASAGNLHFLLALDASSAADIARYEAFMNDLVDLILDVYDGSLKAEHGTGRNMSPFIAREWGPEAIELMWRIKRLADPHGILAPGVVLNTDPSANTANLKTMPRIDALVDACFECGFCEQVCPSRGLTTTPRQRIALRREMVRQPHGSAVQDQLLDEYAYDAVQTCAGDSTCSIACPVDIDTGALMKQFRTQVHGRAAERVALASAEHWAAAQRAARTALSLGGALGDGRMNKATETLRLVVSEDVMPSWQANMPSAAPAKLPATSEHHAHAVYFPACVNRIFGHSRNSTRDKSLPQALVDVSARARKRVFIPNDVSDTCCTTVWHSKGYERANIYMAELVADRLWKWSDGGRLPVVVDATSCTLGLAHEIVPYLDEDRLARHQTLTITDSLTWAAQELLPHLSVLERVPSAVIHSTCSMSQLNLRPDLETVVAAVSDEVLVPNTMTCCAFAGDRGLLHPELTATATAAEAREVSQMKAAAHVSANRTCEIGMEHATGEVYESAILLLEEATRAPLNRT